MCRIDFCFAIFTFMPLQIVSSELLIFLFNLQYGVTNCNVTQIWKWLKVGTVTFINVFLEIVKTSQTHLC